MRLFFPAPNELHHISCNTIQTSFWCWFWCYIGETFYTKNDVKGDLLLVLVSHWRWPKLPISKYEGKWGMSIALCPGQRKMNLVSAQRPLQRKTQRLCVSKIFQQTIFQFHSQPKLKIRVQSNQNSFSIFRIQYSRNKLNAMKWRSHCREPK